MASLAQVRALRIEEGFFRSFQSALQSATALVAPSARSPFEDFGVLAGREIGPRRRSAREIGFTLRDARARIADFIDNTFKADTLSDLMAYLRTRLLKVESRRLPDGRSANYIVDLASRQSVLAASVDRRLSRPGLARMLGRSLDAEAEGLHKSIQVDPEQAEARRLRSFNAARLHSHRTDPDAPPFSDWQDMRFSAPSLFRGREMTVQGSEVWVGYEVARASADPAENIAIMQRMRAEGHKIVVPAKTLEDAKAGRLAAGMPIVYREGAVRTRFISRSLTYVNLHERFAQSPFAYFEEMARRMGAIRGSASNPNTKVVDFNEFKTRFGRKGIPTVAAPALSTRPEIVRHYLIRVGQERMTIVEPETGVELPFNPDKIAAGRYQKEDSFGLPVGCVIVDSFGGYAHVDEQERYHNPYGPAVVPPKGAAEKPRYAIDGIFMSSRDFSARTTSDRLPRRADPVQDFVRASDDQPEAVMRY